METRSQHVSATSSVRPILRGLLARRRTVGLCAAVLLLQPAAAAADEDVQLWVRMGLQYRPDPTVRLGFDQYLRFDENIGRLEQAMPELSLAYFPVPIAGFGFAYRIEHRRKSDGEFQESHRVHLDLHLRSSDEGIAIRYRMRLQPRLKLGPDDLEPPIHDPQPTRHSVRKRLSHHARGIGCTL